MAAKFDPNIEHNPKTIIIAVVALVLAAFAIVFMIIKTGDPPADDATEAAAQP